MSTKLIENVPRNWREATGNVKRWNEKEDMVPEGGHGAALDSGRVAVG